MLILSNQDVSSLLLSLDVPHILHIVHTLASALENKDILQPDRQSFNHPNPSCTTTLIMPTFALGSSTVKIVSLDTSPNSSNTSPQGSLLLLSPDGSLDAVLNASEVTAFRTALGSILPFILRFIPSIISKSLPNTVPLEEVLIFGAGLQAEWAVKLLLILSCNNEIIPKRITIVNRTLPRAQTLISKIQLWYQSKILPMASSTPVFQYYTSNTTNLEALVTSADAIFCCTPSRTSLFPASYIQTRNAMGKTRYISAIGSYTPEMHEIDTELLNSTSEAFVIILDHVSSCIREAGEIIDLVNSDKRFYSVGEEWIKATDNPLEANKYTTSNVFYKSVGTGAMDLAVGRELVKIARDGGGIGTEIPNF